MVLFAGEWAVMIALAAVMPIGAIFFASRSKFAKEIVCEVRIIRKERYDRAREFARKEDLPQLVYWAKEFRRWRVSHWTLLCQRKNQRTTEERKDFGIVIKSVRVRWQYAHMNARVHWKRLGRYGLLPADLQCGGSRGCFDFLKRGDLALLEEMMSPRFPPDYY